MIAALMLAAAAIALPLQQIPEQKLVPGHCVAFLWTKAEPPRRVAMLDETAALLRIRIDGRQRDLPQVAPGRYAADGLAIALDLDLGPRAGMAGGEVVEQGALSFERPGADVIVVPVGGIRACQ